MRRLTNRSPHSTTAAFRPAQGLRSFFSRIVPAGLLVLLPVVAFAQSVRWEPPGGQLGFNRVSELALVFENCEPDGAPQLPAVDGLVVGQPSQRSETNMVNFKVTRRFSLVYPVRPERRTPIAIPNFTVKTDKGPQQVAAASFTVGETTVGSSGLSVADISSVTLATPKRTYWAGEVFPLTYTLSVLSRYFHSAATFVQWAPGSFLAEEWTKPEAGETTVRGERRLVATQTTRAYSRQPGSFTLNPATQVVNLQVGTQGLGLFAMPSVEQRMLTTEPLDVTIRPLPAAPASFSGAVGQFTLTSKVVPTSPSPGEPVTWTLELSGTGNWPDIAGLPEREVSSDFSVIQPKSKRTMKDNALFEGTLGEDVVLVPTKPGRYTLGPVRFTYFDTASGTYRTLSTEAVTVTVGSDTAPITGTSGTFALPPVGQAAPAPGATPSAVPPIPPDRLPRDPLRIRAEAIAPVTTRTLLWTAAGLITLPPLLLWLVLAAQHARAGDPRRRRRLAHRALTALLGRMAQLGDDSAARRRLLSDWQRETAALWNIHHAAPSAEQLATAVARDASATATVWAALWQEADRAQHGPAEELPSDWLLRATGAAQAVRVPGWQFTTLFRRRHLLPFLSAVLMLLAATPGVQAAPTPADYYSQGDFRAAESGWRTVVKHSPTDWAARHDLGLALAQQDQWAEATGHWASAFLLHPRGENTRWNLALGLQRSGLAPAQLVEFTRNDTRHALARLASPAEWQGAVLLASGAFALALMLILLHAYGRTGAWARSAAIVLFVAAVLGGASATLGLHTYGQLADPQAVMAWRTSSLRSLPTEADNQKVTVLSAGSLAVVEHEFLGWCRLRFPGGQTGWARSNDLVRLYR